jgi:predicted helicase
MIKTIKLTNGKRTKLRKHQLKAQEAVSDHYTKGNDRATIVHCCRSGKSLTALSVHKNLKFKATIILVPGNILAQQTLDDWRANLTTARVLVVSSEKAILDGGVTTNPTKIRKFLNESKGKESFIISTYQSAEKVCEAVSEIKDFAFDLMIADEAHNTAGVNLVKGLIHSDDCIPSKRRLYMTATPRHLSQRVRTFSHADATKHCMTDAEVFGEEVDSYLFADGIRDGILQDYEVILVGCNSAERVNAIEDSTNPNHQNIEETAKLITLQKTLSNGENTHCVSFHSRVEKAHFFANNFTLDGWKTFHINGYMKADEKKEVLESFRKANKALLTNCECLQEGVNLKECDSVFFSDVKKGTVDIVQASSRPLTADPNKPKGFKASIIIPTYHQEGDSIDDVISTSHYKILIHILEALRKDDERIDAFLRSLSTRSSSSEPNDDVNSIIKIEGMDGLKEEIFSSIIPSDILHPRYSDAEISRCFSKNGDCYQKVANELGLSIRQLKNRIINSNSLNEKYKWRYLEWTKKFNLLKKFVNEKGRLPISSEEFEGVQIGAWFKNSRNAYNNTGSLSENHYPLKHSKVSEKEALRRKRLLKSLDSLDLNGWVWRWYNTFEECKKWISENKKLPRHIGKNLSRRAKRPLTAEEEEEDRLGRWLSSSKARYGSVSKKKEFAKRRKLLEEIGVTFETKQEKSDRVWLEGFDPLLNNFKEKGSATEGLAGRNYNWLHTQKGRWRRGVLETWKIAHLKKVGISGEMQKRGPKKGIK